MEVVDAVTTGALAALAGMLLVRLVTSRLVAGVLGGEGRSAAAAVFFSCKAARRARNSSNLFWGLAMPVLGVVEEDEDDTAVVREGVVLMGLVVVVLVEPEAEAELPAAVLFNSRRKRNSSNRVKVRRWTAAFRTNMPEFAGAVK